MLFIIFFGTWKSSCKSPNLLIFELKRCLVHEFRFLWLLLFSLWSLTPLVLDIIDGDTEQSFLSFNGLDKLLEVFSLAKFFIFFLHNFEFRLWDSINQESWQFKFFSSFLNRWNVLNSGNSGTLKSRLWFLSTDWCIDSWDSINGNTGLSNHFFCVLKNWWFIVVESFLHEVTSWLWCVAFPSLSALWVLGWIIYKWLE